MTKREWLRATWAEWAPDYRAGRLDLGRVVIIVTTRRRLQRQTWHHMQMGIEVESHSPGAVALTLAELSGEVPPKASVHRLHAV